MSLYSCPATATSAPVPQLLVAVVVPRGQAARSRLGICTHVLAGLGLELAASALGPTYRARGYGV